MKQIKVNYIYLFFIIPVIVFCIANYYVDNDTWFLLNHGRYVLNNGFPTIEPFTIHEGLEFVMQQWGAATIFWIIYNFLGSKGLFLFVVFFGIVIVGLFYKLCNKLCNNKILSICFSVILSFMLRDYIVARPQIFTYFILIFELYFLESYIKTEDEKNLYFLPFLSLLLINMHASMWILQFAFMLPFVINGIKIKKLRFGEYKLKPLLICIIIMFIVGFINPYGYKSMTYVFGSFGIDYINNFIIEMFPLNFTNINCKILIFCLCFILFSFNFFKKRSVELRHLLLLFGTMVMAFMNQKSLPYFFIIYFYVIAYFFKDINFKNIFMLLKNKILKSLVFGAKIGFYLMLIVSLGYTLYYSFPTLKYENDLDDSANIILEDGKDIDIKLYVGYNWGGYMEYRGIKSYIDPRAEVFLKKNNKKEDIMKEYVEIDNEGFNLEKFIDKYDFTHFLVQPNDTLDKYLTNNSEKYTLLYEQYPEGEDFMIAKVYKTINVK